MDIIINATFALPAEHLRNLVASTGQTYGLLRLTTTTTTTTTTTNHPDATMFWFRSPQLHCFEFVVFAVLIAAVYFSAGRQYRATFFQLHPVAAKPAYFADVVLGNVFILCLIANVIFKISRDRGGSGMRHLPFMLNACHAASAYWAWILLSKPEAFNYAQCRWYAAMMCLSTWTALIALVSPDTTFFEHPLLEHTLFYVQHGVLAFAPHYWACRHGLPKLSRGLLAYYFCFAMTWNFFIYTPACYVLGANINYNLHPPRGLLAKHEIFRTQWYRFVVPVVLIVVSVAYWYVLVATAVAWKWFWRRAAEQTGKGSSSKHDDEKAKLLNRKKMKLMKK